MQGLTALLVIGGIIYIVVSSMIKKNPKVADHIKSIIPDKLFEQPQTLENKEFKQQIYDEKRTMM